MRPRSVDDSLFVILLAMNTFYIVRHGETENNRAKRLSGWIDTPLTETGLLTSTKVATKFASIPVNAIYSSDLGRAFITAYTLALLLHFSKPIIRLAGLREVNYGDAANMYTEDAYELFPQLDRDTHYIPPNGESLEDMQRRVLRTIDDINKQYTNASIILVCHSGVLTALHASHTGQDLGERNICDEYPHDFVAKCTLDDMRVTSFKQV
jgi:probable phosphoglycerate mutase